MTLKIGDKVMIKTGRRPSPGDGSKGVIIEMKWNLAKIRFNDGTTDWIVNERIVKNDTLPA